MSVTRPSSDARRIGGGTFRVCRSRTRGERGDGVGEAAVFEFVDSDVEPAPATTTQAWLSGRVHRRPRARVPRHSPRDRPRRRATPTRTAMWTRTICPGSSALCAHYFARIHDPLRLRTLSLARRWAVARGPSGCLTLEKGVLIRNSSSRRMVETMNVGVRHFGDCRPKTYVLPSMTRLDSPVKTHLYSGRVDSRSSVKSDASAKDDHACFDTPIHKPHSAR